MFHGFLLPENILMSNVGFQPVFKLLDVKALSRYGSCYERMLMENDYFAPLDPELLLKYKQNNPIDEYEFYSDVWAFGIATLCYVFYEDFHIFYDWNTREIRYNKVQQYIELMAKLQYDSNLVQLIAQMLQKNSQQRITIEYIYKSCQN